MRFLLLTIIGVCQANDIDGADASIVTGWHKHNNTMEHHAKKPSTAHNNQPISTKGESRLFKLDQVPFSNTTSSFCKVSLMQQILTSLF